jgi:hypothetical protein
MAGIKGHGQVVAGIIKSGEAKTWNDIMFI